MVGSSLASLGLVLCFFACPELGACMHAWEEVILWEYVFVRVVV